MSDDSYAWARAEERALARYVQPDHLPAEFRLPAYINRLDLLRAEGALGVAGALFGQLLKQKLQYDLAPFSPRVGVTQLIRRPATILAERRGTCLDLAVLFAAMCLDSDLLPLIVVVEGHAFAGLSRTRTRQDNKRAPKALAWDRGKLTDLGVLRDLTDVEYAWVECTGAAASQSLAATFPEGQGRDPASGRMTFERACEAGSQQIRQATRMATDPPRPDQREFLYALDIQDLQVNQGFEPVTDDADVAGSTIVHGNLVQGDQRNINTGGGGYFEGPINVNGDFVGGSKTINQQAGGDIVGRDKITNIQHDDSIKVGPISNSTGIAIGHGAQASVTQGVSGADLATLFAGIYHKIDDRPDDPNVDKEDVKYKVGRIEQEVQKQDSASEPKLQGWLGELASMAPDIFDVTVAALAGPTAAVSTIIKKVADKAKQLSGRG
jgi:hypothetical protein